MVRKMFEKAGMIPGLQAGPRPVAAPGDSTKAKTAPGAMMRFVTAQSTAMVEAEVLKERCEPSATGVRFSPRLPLLDNIACVCAVDIIFSHSDFP